MNILYKLTSRSRPVNFFRAINSIQSLSTRDEYHIHATLDFDDVSMNNDSVMNAMDDIDHLTYRFDFSDSKVHAINRDMEFISYKWDILVNMSDDMIFVKQGFDEIIISDMIHCDDLHGRLDTVLHYDDGNSYKSELMTLSIIGREYYNRDNYIYHPDYISLWCDNEAMEVAKLRGKYKYMGDGNVLFNHLHPMHNKRGVMDAQYRKTDSFFAYDKNTFERRKLINFGLKKDTKNLYL